MLEMKYIVREIKKALNGLIIRLYTAGKKISELEKQPIKITPTETQKERVGGKKNTTFMSCGTILNTLTCR